MPLSPQEYANKSDSELLQLIKIQNWAQATLHLHESSQTDEFGNLPLHAAIGFKAPDRLILDILEKYPEATHVHGSEEWLPLHVAAMYGCSSAVMKALILANPDALDDSGKDTIKGRTPRHFSNRFNHNKHLVEHVFVK